MVRRVSFIICVVSLAALLAAPSPALAQVTSGTILGTIAEESKAVVPSAVVTVTNKGTQFFQIVVTDDRGRYRVPNLPLGMYEVRVDKDGFAPSVRSGIELTVGREAVVDFVLMLPSVIETVFVTADAPLVNSTTSALGYLVDEMRIHELPLNKRDLAQLVLLQPGVVLSRASQSSSNVGRGTKMSVSGARPNQNLFTLDGTDYNDALNNTPGSAQGLMMGVETVKEFQVLTHTYSAEYGRATGGVFNVVTKSGSNEVTGSAFEFFRDDQFDAKNYFDTEKPDFWRHQFGATVGGPISEDKVFFFGSYEGLREYKGITQVTTVPDAEARLGILPNGKSEDVSPTIRSYLGLYPAANGPQLFDSEGARTGAAEYRGVFGRDSRADFGMVRVDANLSDRQTFFARYLYDDSTIDEPVTFPQFSNIVTNKKHVATATHRMTFASGILNELRFGFNRARPREDVNPDDPYAALAFVPAIGIIGEINVSGLGEIGTDRTNPKAFFQDLFQIQENLIFVRGAHAIKAGASASFFQYDAVSDSRTRGRLRFRSISDFLRGRPRNFEFAGDRNFRPATDANLFRRQYDQALVGFYLQDDWTLGSQLTLNLGLRYEFVTTPTERNGLVSQLLTDQGSTFPIEDAKLVEGGQLFKNNTKRNIAPRVGFAYSIGDSGRTAIRGGFGMFYEPPLFQQYRAPIFRNYPFVTRVRIDRPKLPIDFSRIDAGGDTETEVIEYDLDPAYVTHYNVNLQHELGAGTVVMLGYVGSRGTNLMGQADLNTAKPVIMPDGREFFPEKSERRNKQFTAIGAVFGGFSSRYHGLHAGIQKRLSHNVQFQASYTLGDSVDNRSGSGGRQEFRNGQARSFDPYNKDLDKGPSDYSVRHTFVFNASYQLPGRNPIIGGWQLNAIGTFATGVPFTPVVTGDPDRDQSEDNMARPDVVAGVSTVPSGGRTAEQWFNPLAFKFPGPGYRGNAGRNILEGPGFATLDLALVKSFRLGGRVQAQFRGEVFNVLNRANFDLPLNDPDGAAIFNEEGERFPDTGKIFATVTDGREAQFAIKLLF